jgi:hypothetical protein
MAREVTVKLTWEQAHALLSIVGVMEANGVEFWGQSDPETRGLYRAAGNASERLAHAMLEAEVGL